MLWPTDSGTQVGSVSAPLCDPKVSMIVGEVEVYQCGAAELQIIRRFCGIDDHPFEEGSRWLVRSSPFGCRLVRLKRTPLDQLALGVPINVNRVHAGALVALPGVGQTIADRLIRGRPYSHVDDLLRVKGIGPKSLYRMAPLVRTGPPDFVLH